MTEFTDLLASASAQVVERVQRSLVVLHNGRHGVGAGVIWRRGGLVLTNFHVAADKVAFGTRVHPGGRHPQSQALRVELADGRQYPAQVLAEDPEIDLALLQIEAHDLPAALIAESRNLRVGELALAIGHPWGQRGMVTVGMISALGMAETRGPRQRIEIIRSDVRLAPGNSGGPLVNANGAVIGINTMIIGGDQGLAIPSHIASAFADSVGKN